MATKRLITDRFLRALAPAPRGERIEVWDSRVPGFGIRVSDIKDADPARRGKAGKIAFVLYARFGAGAAPTRRVIGTYGAITLEDARRTAGEWRSLIDKGIDPAVIEAEAAEKAARERAARIKHSFGNVAEAFIADKLAQERRGKNAERDFRANFVAAWRDRPISEITTLDVLELINKKKRTAPQMARALLVLIRRFFNWVHRPARLRPDRLAVRPAQGREDHRPGADAQPPPHRRGTVRVLASHRTDEIPGRFALPRAAAHRAAAQRSRAAVVAGSPRRHHRHPGIADEGQGRQGARASGAAVVGGTGRHRVGAALSRRTVRVLIQRRQASSWR